MKKNIFVKIKSLSLLKKTTIVLGLVIALLIIFQNPASGASTYYVSTSGSNPLGDGSFTYPWRTIDYAATKVQAGDTVYIRGGTYNEKVTIDNLQGASNAWITFKAYNNEKVIISGAGIPGSYDGVFQLNDGCKFIRITGLEIANGSYAGIFLYGGEITDIQVDNCTIHNCQSSGIYAYSGDYGSSYVRRVEFGTNTVYDVNNGLAGQPSYSPQEAISFSGIQGFNIHHNNLSKYGKEGIDCKSGSSNGEVHHNTINNSLDSPAFQWDYNHVGIYIDGYTRTNHDINIYSNSITGYGGTAIMIGAEHPESGGKIEKINIYNNLVSISYAAGHSQFRSLDSILDGPWKDIFIYNNTFYGNSDNSPRIFPSAINITNLVIANNIFSGTGYNLIHFQNTASTEAPGHITLSDNLYYRFGGMGHNVWSNGTDKSWGQDPVLNTDPKFVNLGATNLRLQSDSPAKDQGSSVYAPGLDYDGVSRPQDSADDIGAFEFLGGGGGGGSSDPTRIQKMSITYSGRINNLSIQEYIGKHFDLVDTELSNGGNIAIGNIKAVNPNFKGIGYYESIFSLETSPYYWTDINPNESWFMHMETTGNRLERVKTEYQGQYLMNPSPLPSSGWSDFTAKYLKDKLDDYSNYNGVFLDDYAGNIESTAYGPYDLKDAITNDRIYVPYSDDIRNNYSIANWRSWMISYTNLLKTTLDDDDIIMTNSHIDTYLGNIAETMLWEGFVHARSATYTSDGYTPSSIFLAVDALHEQAELGKVIAVNGGCYLGNDSQKEEWAKFVYACFSFAVGDDLTALTKAYFSWEFMPADPSSGVPTYYPFMDIQIGAPIGTDNYKQIKNNVYFREFTYYYIVANLDTLSNSESFTFNGTDYTLQGKHALFIQKTGVPPPPPPPPPPGPSAPCSPATSNCINPCIPNSTCSDHTGNCSTAYSCAGAGCGDDVLQTVCECHQDYICSSQGDWVLSGAPHCDANCATSIFENCDSWEICNAASHSCNCSANCLSNPTNMKLYDGLGAVSNNNVRLPIKFTWDPVPGAQSYWYRTWKIDPPTVTSFDAAEAKVSGLVSDGSTNVIPASGNETPCFLKLPDNTNYSQSTSTDWQITPCCDAAGFNCKDWSNVPINFFEVSLAPQLISPADPDWNNTAQMAENVLLPVKLSWCNVKEEDYYALRIYNADGSCHPFLQQGTGCSFKKIDKEHSVPYESPIVEFRDNILSSYFMVNNDYKWEVSSCHKAGGTDVCTSPSQQWQLSTENLAPEGFSLLSPQNQILIPIGFPITIKWQGKLGLNSFKYIINGVERAATVGKYFITFNYDDLNLNTIYQWDVKGCLDYSSQNCGSLSSNGPWRFKTTGAAPILSYPDINESDVLIPVNFDWEDIGGAKSYRIEILDNSCNSFNPKKEYLVFSSNSSIDYPDLQMNTNYCWKVQTCADEAGTITRCGLFSNTREFTTFDIEKPILLSPSGVINDPTRLDFSWNPVLGAKFYKYNITYLPPAAPPEEIANNTITSNNVSLPSIMLPEAGNYEWKVQACLDLNCTAGNWSDISSFNLNFIASSPEQKGGFVPCGRKYDNPDTFWNERESCQIKHLFFMMRSILDFILWKVATILMALILLAIGILFYASKGESTVVQQVKSVMRSAAIGYFIIFGAWLVINLIMALLGYQFEFFGRWWDIGF